MGDVSACHSVIEETEMGHYRPVCVMQLRCYLMRLILLGRFLDLLTHFVTRSIQFARALHMRSTNEELLSWTIPLTVVGK